MDAGHPGKTEAQVDAKASAGGSSKPSFILLYAGKDDAGALDAYLHAYNPAFSEYIWAVDIRRKGGDLGQDMLGEEPYLTMCSMAMAGKVALVGGGPNCRTWSILRWFPKPGGPPPVRGRAEQTLWGLEDLECRVMEDTDNDSVLMLRQMYLTLLAYKGLGQLTVPQVGSSFLEHPMVECSKSPSAARCSSISIWVTRAYVQDECLGQVVVKSTALSTDLPLHHWHDLRCNHGSHPRGEKLNSSELSRCPEQMMQGLAAAILCRAGPVLEARGRGAWRPRLTQRPPKASKGTFSQHAGGQQAPVPEAEGGPTSVGRTLGSLPVSALDTPAAGTSTQRTGEGQDLCPHFAMGGQAPGVALVGGGVTSLPGGPTRGHQGDSGAGGRPTSGRPTLLPGHLAQHGSEHSGPRPTVSPDLEQGVPLKVTDPPLTSPGIWPLKKELKGGTGVSGTPPPNGQG